MLFLNPNRIAEFSMIYKIPLNPAENTNHPSTPGGPIGVTLNGVAFFNQYAGGGAPLTNEINSFEQYGGHLAPDSIDGGADAGGADQTEGSPVGGPSPDAEQDDSASASDSYAVVAFEQARTSMTVVDTWASRIARVQAHSESARDRQLLYEDGQALLAAFERQVGRLEPTSTSTAIGPRLAAEELRLRLRLQHVVANP